MKKFLNYGLKIMTFTWIFLSLTIGDILAQCAMCKASVETNVNVDGIGLADKLNTGILYLFVTPYLLAVIIGVMWYRKSREQQQKVIKAQELKQRIASL